MTGLIQESMSSPSSAFFSRAKSGIFCRAELKGGFKVCANQILCSLHQMHVGQHKSSPQFTQPENCLFMAELFMAQYVVEVIKNASFFCMNLAEMPRNLVHHFSLTALFMRLQVRDRVLARVRLRGVPPLHAQLRPLVQRLLLRRAERGGQVAQHLPLRPHLLQLQLH